MNTVFSVFASSVEQVQVKSQQRGAIDNATPTFQVTLSAIVKRRDSMTTSTENSEDRNTQTTIHFKPDDAQYIAVGNYVQIDGNWRTIEQVKDGKNFATGTTEFLLATVGDDIINLPDEPNWAEIVSA